MNNHEFVERVLAVNNNIELLSEYVNYTTKIRCKCKQCGNEWATRPQILYLGCGCPECAKKRVQQKRRTPPDVFAKKIQTISPNIELISSYVNTSTNILCRCKTCNYEWECRPNLLLNGGGCPRCTKHIIRTHEQFVEEIKKNKPTIRVLGKFTRTKDHIECQCTVCNYVWEPVASSILYRKDGCPNCHKTKRRTSEEFIVDLKQINPNIQVLSTFLSMKSPIKCKCLRCNYEWDAAPYNLLRSSGGGCPLCSRAQTSFMEQFILWSFRKCLGEKKVKSRDKEAIGMELDIYIPELKLAIEPGSWKLHSKSIDRDTTKREKCKQLSIRLITIYDQVPPDMETPFSEDCFLFSQSLGYRQGYQALQNIIISILQQYSVDYSMLIPSWDEIRKIAHLHSGRMTHAQYSKLLSKINPNIELLEQFTVSQNTIFSRCTVCGYEWHPKAQYLLISGKCPKCNGKGKRTKESFQKELSLNDPNIVVIGEYKNALTKIEMACQKCGEHFWATAAHMIHDKRGCPYCHKDTRGEKQRLSQDAFSKRVKQLNPSVEVVSKYMGMGKDVIFLCNECGNTWKRRAGNFLHESSSCPICKKKMKTQTK